MNRVLGLPFWIAALIADIRRRTQARIDQDRAYRMACHEAALTRARKRPQLQEDISDGRRT